MIGPASLTVARTVLQEGAPSYREAGELPEFAHGLGSTAVFLVPLVRGEKRLGLLALGVPAPLPDAAAGDLVEIGHAFVLVIEHVRLLRRIDLQMQLQDVLRTMTASVPSAASLRAALASFAVAAAELIPGAHVSVWLHDRQRERLVLEASSHPDQYFVGDHVPTTRSSPLVEALRQSAEEVREVSPKADRRISTVALRGRRRALGVLVLECGDAGEPDPAGLARELGRQLSGVIENVQLFEQLLRSRRELENTFNSIADLVLVCDRRMRLVNVNEAFASRLRQRRDELRERPLSDFVDAETAHWIATLDLRHSSGASAATRQIEDGVLGGTFSLTVTALLNHHFEPAGTVVVARDVSVEARLEAEQAALRSRLAQAEKLAALGQFVAGIAHELNNPLQSVLGHAELLQASASIPKEVRRDLQIVHREADRAGRIVQKLLLFAGSGRLARRRIRLPTVLSRVLALRAAACRAAGIEIARDFAEDLPRISGDPIMLQQAFLNIVMNAEQAMRASGGRLQVRTSVTASRDRVVIEIRDTGPGIPEENLCRVFEPFYTTKDVGEGIGLGLALTYGIVQEHGGRIAATNHESGGAVFTIELPASD
jgi:signal transduction histidine kinase